MKLTEYGVVTPPISEEDRRSALLAKRAQQGDYDDGMFMYFALHVSA